MQKRMMDCVPDPIILGPKEVGKTNQWMVKSLEDMTGLDDFLFSFIVFLGGLVLVMKR